ncbi:MAG: hypothetical protein WCD89_09590, partial [Anaerocolumna sp.]
RRPSEHSEGKASKNIPMIDRKCSQLYSASKISLLLLLVSENTQKINNIIGSTRYTKLIKD